MGMGKQAKILNEHQLQALLSWLNTRKHADRNRLIVLLSYKAGLRAKEIASLEWSMVMKADGEISDHIHLTDEASKGKSGRIIALNKELKKQLIKVKGIDGINRANSGQFVIRTCAEPEQSFVVSLFLLLCTALGSDCEPIRSNARPLSMTHIYMRA